MKKYCYVPIIGFIMAILESLGSIDNVSVVVLKKTCIVSGIIPIYTLVLCIAIVGFIIR